MGEQSAAVDLQDKSKESSHRVIPRRTFHILPWGDLEATEAVLKIGYHSGIIIEGIKCGWNSSSLS